MTKNEVAAELNDRILGATEPTTYERSRNANGGSEDAHSNVRIEHTEKVWVH